MRTTVRIRLLVGVLLAAACGGQTVNGEPLPDPGPDEIDSTVERASTDIPSAITDNLSTVDFSVSLYPMSTGQADPRPAGLRSLTLYQTETRREPHAQWNDGTPVGADALLTEDQASLLLRALAVETGFFAHARRFHSERRQERSTPPPAGSQPTLPGRDPEPNVEVTVTYHDDDWHHYWVGSWPWGDEARTKLQALEAAIERELASG